jgi:hypothetical protein
MNDPQKETEFKDHPNPGHAAKQKGEGTTE